MYKKRASLRSCIGCDRNYLISRRTLGIQIAIVILLIAYITRTLPFSGMRLSLALP